MPKYVYKCDYCTAHFELYHGMNETQEECIYCCAQSPHRVPQLPFLKRSGESKGGKVGDETKSAIEANRELLREMKKDSKEEFYRDDN